MPSFSKSSTPFTSPLQAMNSNCIVESRFSGTVRSLSWLGLRRIGSSDDWRPKLNLRLLRLGSKDDCRVNCRLRFLLREPVENWREMPCFNCAAMFSMASRGIESQAHKGANWKEMDGCSTLHINQWIKVNLAWVCILSTYVRMGREVELYSYVCMFGIENLTGWRRGEGRIRSPSNRSSGTVRTQLYERKEGVIFFLSKAFVSTHTRQSRSLCV